jgi:hypothetical protein
VFSQFHAVMTHYKIGKLALDVRVRCMVPALLSVSHTPCLLQVIEFQMQRHSLRLQDFETLSTVAARQRAGEDYAKDLEYAYVG